MVRLRSSLLWLVVLTIFFAPASITVGASGTTVVADDLMQHPDRFELLANGGLFVDCGSRGFLKYTQGNWRTGWKQPKQGGCFIAGARGKLYLPVLNKANYTLVFEAKPSRKLQTITIAVENKVRTVVRLNNQDWSVYAADLGELDVGDTMLDLRMNRTRKGKGASIRWLWLVNSEALARTEDGLPVLPQSWPSVKKDSGGVELPAQTGVRIYLFPHKGVWLELGLAGDGLVRVSAASEGESLRSLYQGAAADLTGKRLEISAWFDKVFFVQIENLSEAPVELRSARLMAEKLPPRVSEIKRPKNVIVYLIDTLRRDKLSIYNPKTRVKTPNIEKLAKRGVVFDNCYVQGNWSKSSSAAFFTGLYPQRTFAETVSERLAKKFVLLPERLKAAGFKTGAFISNGYLGAKFGFRQGWDYYRNPIRENLPSDTEHLLKLFWPWLEKVKDEPFFAYLGTIDPHVPYDPPKRFLKMYDPKPYNYKKGPIQPRKTGYLLAKIKKNPKIMSERDWFHLEALYDGEVSYNDDQLGKMWARIEQMGLAEETMLVITSDHGDEFRDHGSVGHGHTVYEELIHMPLIIVYPPLFPPGLRIEDYVEHIDLHATILDVLGVPVPKEIDGESFLPLVVDPTPHKRWYAFSTMLDRYRTVVTGGWKLLLKGPAARLYNLKNDPKERRNVRRAHPVVSAYLRGLISPWVKDTMRSYRKEPLP